MMGVAGSDMFSARHEAGQGPVGSAVHAVESGDGSLGLHSADAKEISLDRHIANGVGRHALRARWRAGIYVRLAVRVGGTEAVIAVLAPEVDFHGGGGCS